jgi:acyl-coenzyme A thioesterase PaaI-like protein
MSSSQQGFLTKVKLTPRLMRWLFNIWPPFIGAGIHVLAMSPDWRSARVRLRLNWLTQNYAGTAFGGSLFAMTDPFYMIMVGQSLGSDYIVWDKAGSVRFIKPGRSHVYADVTVTDAMLDDIRENAAQAKYEPTYSIDICDAQGTLIAQVSKTLYIRRK